MTTDEMLEQQYRQLLRPGRQRYDYQIEVGRRVLEGRNVVLRAPTGCGKTLAVVVPFLVGKSSQRWRRLIYALPLRALASSVYEEARRIVGQASLTVTLQTGEQRDDPYFDRGDIIVTTYDQLLSGMLSSPYGLGGSLHNVNGAAVAGALVVFDEFHLMEPARAFLTGAALLRLFRELSQSVWMTATATSALADVLADCLDTIVMGPGEPELSGLPCIARVDRRLVIERQPLSARRVLECHSKRTLVVTNQVRWAQELYDALEQQAPHIQKLLLHSLFFREDRAEREERLRRWFGPAGDAEGIVIATQVVEAGLDLTCDQLHTVVCPMNALVQRAGRNVRFPPAEGQVARGEVHVYPLPDLTQPWRPYEEASVQATWQVLADGDGARLDPATLAGWVEMVHADSDAEALRLGWHRRLHCCVHRISLNSIQRQPDEVASLIRQVAHVRLVLGSPPPGSPFELDGFSVNRGRIGAVIEQLGGGEGVWGWQAGIGDEPRWQPLTDRAEAFGACYAFCIAPEVAAYDAERGLRLGEAGSIASPARPLPPRPGYGGLGKERWLDHSRNVTACVDLRGGVDLAEGSLLAEGLVRRYGLSAAQVRRAARAAGELHDFGKLLAQWQGWAEAYQQLKEPGYRHLLPLAHTEYDGAVWWDRELSRQVTRVRGGRGPHAAPGAFVSLLLLPSLLEHTSEADRLLLLCAAGGILGHHGGWLGGEENSELGAGLLWPGWAAEVGELLGRTIDPTLRQQVEAGLKRTQKRQSLARALRAITSIDRLSATWPLLAYLTRTLRLSDQKATEEGSDGS